LSKGFGRDHSKVVGVVGLKLEICRVYGLMVELLKKVRLCCYCLCCLCCLCYLLKTRRFYYCFFLLFRRATSYIRRKSSSWL
jgi:hypothetical protein